MLNYSRNSFGYLTNLIEWLFLKAETNFDVESNYYITSECVGKLAFLHSSAAKKVIENTHSII
jgi:hypothetical protein